MHPKRFFHSFRCERQATRDCYSAKRGIYACARRGVADVGALLRGKARHDALAGALAGG